MYSGNISIHAKYVMLMRSVLLFRWRFLTLSCGRGNHGTHLGPSMRCELVLKLKLLWTSVGALPIV